MKVSIRNLMLASAGALACAAILALPAVARDRGDGRAQATAPQGDVMNDWAAARRVHHRRHVRSGPFVRYGFGPPDPGDAAFRYGTLPYRLVHPRVPGPFAFAAFPVACAAYFPVDYATCGNVWNTWWYW